MATSEHLRRVALALTQSDLPAAAVELALRLARRLDAELAALIEDTNLLRAAALPFARELLWHTDEERELDAEALRLRLQQRARRVRAELERRAQEQGVTLSFHTLRGPGFQPLLRPAPFAELTVLAASRTVRRHRQDSGERIVILQTDAATAATLAALVERLISAGSATRTEYLPWTDVETLVAAGQRLRPALVVAPAAAVPVEALYVLAQRLACPLVLVAR